jgi:hypothetical protein
MGGQGRDVRPSKARPLQREAKRTMRAIYLQIPEGLPFSARRLVRKGDGVVAFDMEPIRRICAANGLDLAVFTDGPEDHLCELITAWYIEHRRGGGAPDPVQEDLIAEVQVEYALGGGLSHRPGTA